MFITYQLTMSYVRKAVTIRTDQEQFLRNHRELRLSGIVQEALDSVIRREVKN